ncbi:elongation factor 1-beta-like [Durio zibethinus]|uniref:Elongation factor 1-beta-like n=1 Tax=Durio zibethinus TaxID=66656 RepID=A0A6P5XR76_DURZI|nr:elongation factor 1-beta-like [Durio zibethinus]
MNWVPRFTNVIYRTLLDLVLSPPLEAPGADDDDDDLDLFGDETEEDNKAAEEREAWKKSAKKKESGKSSVLMDVKPWDDETDMKKLEESIRSVEMPGFFSGASKLVPVGYGIKKLQIMHTIVDDLVSVDTLVEDHLTAEPCKEYVQSCDLPRTKFKRLFILQPLELANFSHVIDLLSLVFPPILFLFGLCLLLLLL